MKIAIIGAGASGLFAAVKLVRGGQNVTLFERESRAGKKLLATGNGRCNLTNAEISVERYHGEPEFSDLALTIYNQYIFTDFMESIGVPLITEESGKIYPRSLQASSVLDMLRLSIGNSVRTETEVIKLVPYKKSIGVVTKSGEEKFDKVIVCVGGKASSKLSGGGAYNLLTDLGHTKTELTPSIVQLKCKGTKALEGIKVNANVKIGDRSDYGEVLFTSYGLSGPPILQLSRDAVGKTAEIDLCPDLNFKEITDYLMQKRKLSYLTAENLFTGFLNKILGREILRAAGITPFSKPVPEISDREIKSLANITKCFKFGIEGHNGFENAQVTAGGIKCSEFYKTTMESRLVRGVYAAGEVLNIDGDCGGFNLQWAFSSACLAADSILKEASENA